MTSESKVVEIQFIPVKKLAKKASYKTEMFWPSVRECVSVCLRIKVSSREQVLQDVSSTVINWNSHLCAKGWILGHALISYYRRWIHESKNPKSFSIVHFLSTKIQCRLEEVDIKVQFIQTRAFRHFKNLSKAMAGWFSAIFTRENLLRLIFYTMFPLDGFPLLAFQLILRNIACDMLGYFFDDLMKGAPEV